MAIVPSAVGAERGRAQLALSSATPTVSSMSHQWREAVERERIEKRRVTVQRISSHVGPKQLHSVAVVLDTAKETGVASYRSETVASLKRVCYVIWPLFNAKRRSGAIRCSRAIESASKSPRLPVAKAWTSSTTIVFSPANIVKLSG